MKKLYVVRHAKSDWDNAAEIMDIDRPLNSRGVRNAYEMASRLNSKKLNPDSIIASNGIRALHTAVIFAHELNFDSQKITIIPELYHSSASEMLRQIKNTSDSSETLMLFAHNPGISEFASFVNKVKYIDVATCGVLEINVNTSSWSDINFDKMDLVSYDFPKNR